MSASYWSPDSFREDANAIRDRADWAIFMLLAVTSTAVSLTYVLVALIRDVTPLFQAVNVASLMLCTAVIFWTLRTRRAGAGTCWLAGVLVAGVTGIVLIQRGSPAPGLAYGLTTVAVVFIAGHGRLAWLLAGWLLAWTSAVTWAAGVGWLGLEAGNPLGVDRARLMAFAISALVIGTAAAIVERRRRELAALLESALVRTEAERDEARQLAERRARTVAEIGHEIRTPMTGIVGVTQVIARHLLPPALRQLLAIQRRSAENLLQLVNAVLDEAKIESGPRQTAALPFSLRQLVADVIDLFAAQAHRKGIEIIWTAEPAAPRHVVGDAMRTRQIVSNLVSNAVKYSDRGFIEVRIVAGGPGRVGVEVHDSGPGIPAHRAETIFERFVGDHRDGAAASKVREGLDAMSSPSTGLGLSISRELAWLIGGTISVTARAEGGSRFMLEMPASATGLDSDGDVGAADRAIGAARTVPATFVPRGRVWVVGASHPLQRQMQFLLGEMGVEACYVDRLPDDAEWADTGAGPQVVMLDTWSGHGRCADLLPQALDAVRRDGRRLIVVNDVAQDAALGVLDDIWQMFRPAQQAALDDALSWAFEARGAADAAATDAATRPWRVLLVDDNAVNQIVGKAMLELLGARVEVADDGEAALRRLAAGAYDIVLMDLQMPGIDGIETTRRLRAAEAAAGHPPVPVLAVTGLTKADVEPACRLAGIDDMIIKPYTIEQLKSLIDSHVQRVMR